jgi:signal transduction histidine kinase
MPLGGDLVIRAEKTRTDRTEIIFSNTGELIPDENLSRIFDPFFTTKEKGTGLGLWIVSKEVARNGGTIEASNQGVTQIKLILPGKEENNENNIDD